MNDAAALHTEARRYCMEQYSTWLREYIELCCEERFRVERLPASWTYSPEACKQFPRYRLAEATLLNIESYFPDVDASLQQVLQELRDAGRRALSGISEELSSLKHKQIAFEALNSQNANYCDFIADAASRDLSDTQPLPFRRVLSALESKYLWDRLKRRWLIRGQGHGWFPLTHDVPPSDALTFHAELWNVRHGKGLLLDYFEKQDIKRCYVLRELGPPDFEIESTIADSVSLYDGSESFLFSGEDWILYTSHESSVTLAGSLAAFLRSRWADADGLSYRGPFHTEDLRGSWNSS